MYCKFHIGQRQSQWTNWHNDNELKVSEHLRPSTQNVIKHLKGNLQTWATELKGKIRRMIQALIQSSLFDCAMDRPAFGKVFQADDNDDYMVMMVIIMMPMMALLIYILWCSVCVFVCHKKWSLPTSKLSAGGVKWAAR